MLSLSLSENIGTRYMRLCHICTEFKEENEFITISNFTKYKKQPAIWCQDCQKMYLDMKRKKKAQEKFLLIKEEQKFDVSFE